MGKRNLLLKTTNLLYSNENKTTIKKGKITTTRKERKEGW